jgi:hypothetical protein
MNRLDRFIIVSTACVTLLMLPSAAHAACTSPAAAAGSLNWNSGTTQFQYCDGTTWQNFGVAASFGAGTLSAPGWAVTGDTDTGLWAPAANTLSVSAGGVEVERWNTVASGVDYFSITPSATGAHTITLGAAGTDASIDIAITPKGGGSLTTSGSATNQISSTTSSTGGRAVYGVASATTSSSSAGVYGQSSGDGGVGVQGVELSSSGSTYGGYFSSAGSFGIGVYGVATSTTGATYGGKFVNNSSAGTALYASAGNAATKGLVVQGAASQTGDLAEFQNSSGTALAVVNASGNVGIGVTSPGTNLQIGDGTGTANPKEIKLFSGYPTANVGTTGTVSFHSNVGGGIADQLVGSIRGYMQPSPNVNGLQFLVGDWNNNNALPSSVAMTIQSGGNVGIGTAPTFGKLQVTGLDSNNVWVNFNNSDFNGPSGTTGSGINFRPGATSGDTYSIIQAYQGGGSAVANLSLNNFGGNVGIGTAATGHTLTVKNTATDATNPVMTLALNRQNSNTEALLLGADTNSNAVISSNGGGALLFGNNASGNATFTEGMRLTGGNVGIGTTAINGWGSNFKVLQLSTGLNVAGGPLPTSNYGNYFAENSYFDGTNWKFANTGPASVFTAAGGTQNIRVAASGTGGTNITWTTGFAVDNTGKVGIGTGSPAVALDVYGSVNLRDAYNLTWGGAYGAHIPTIVGSTNSSAGYLAFYPDGSTSGERMRIDSSGNVNIGTSGQAYKLYVAGTTRLNGNVTIIGTLFLSGTGAGAGDSYLCYNTGTGLATWNGAGCNVSDVRLKKNIQTLENPLDKIAQLRGVTFDWKTETKAHHGPQIGFIAQEVEKVFPSAVATGEDGMKSVSYDKLVAPLVEGVKALKADNDNLRREVEELRREIHAH